MCFKHSHVRTSLDRLDEMTFITEVLISLYIDMHTSIAYWCFTAPQGVKSLNRIQSIVFPTAYGTNENMLICAPTGAGKTNVAMMTVLKTIENVSLVLHCIVLYCIVFVLWNQNESLVQETQFFQQHIEMGVIQRDSFKIVYVAPMKALAAEMVENFGKRYIHIVW